MTFDPVSIAPVAADQGEIAYFRTQDGLSLAMRIFGAPSARLPLLCLAGLSRNSRDFLELGRYFSSSRSRPRQVFALDYRGRGLSDPDRDWRNYTPLTEAQYVLAAATAFGLERAIVIGTSRGGIIAMLLGALRPNMLAGVVLNDIGPVIEGTGLARIKRYLTAQQSVGDWRGATHVVRATQEPHFPALSDDDWRAFTEAYYAEGPNGLAPHFDRNLLKTVEDLSFLEAIPVLWPQFASLRNVPVLALRGEHSDVLSPRTLAAMAAQHPRFEQLTVHGQGHPPLLRDGPTLERIGAFVERRDSSDKS